MKPWQRLFLFGAAFGISFAIAIAIIISLISWYQSRPVPWNTKAITAEFDSVDTEGEKNCLEFYYVLKNNTDKDWLVSENDEIRGSFIHSKGVLSAISKSTVVTIDKPLFIPAKHKMDVKVHSGLICPNLPKDNLQPDRKAVEKSLKSISVDALSGFVFFDEKNRYEISLPADWKEISKKSK
jgi:hypothetical protein